MIRQVLMKRFRQGTRGESNEICIGSRKKLRKLTECGEFWRLIIISILRSNWGIRYLFILLVELAEPCFVFPNVAQGHRAGIR